MASLDPNVELLRRQFLQLVAPEQLTFPPRAVLKTPEIQAQIFRSMFQPGRVTYQPPERYKSRVLKLLVMRLEQSIDDPEEDEISDDLTACLAETLAQPIVSDMEQAQRKSYVTYSAPLSLSMQAFAITTLESPAILAAAGTTGLRTWEAAKFLTTFMCSAQGAMHVHGKRVIELGAGTGLVSMFCARHFGAEFVLATDGTGEVVDSIVQNMYLNQLDDRRLMDAVVLKWGHAITPELIMDEQEDRHYDLLLGADIVSLQTEMDVLLTRQIFDDRLILPLVSTINELFIRYNTIKGLISATVRNEATVDKFIAACCEH